MKESIRKPLSGKRRRVAGLNTLSLLLLLLLLYSLEEILGGVSKFRGAGIPILIHLPILIHCGAQEEEEAVCFNAHKLS